MRAARNTGTATWHATGPATDQALVRVTSVSNRAVFDVSDEVFAITEP